MRRLLLTAVPALLAGALVVPSGAVERQPPTRPDPCTLSFTDTEGDGRIDSNVATPNGVASDPDLDITRVTVRLTPTDLVTTIEVADLAEHPLTNTGDQFNVGMTDGEGYGSWGYLRDVDGGRPHQEMDGFFFPPSLGPQHPVVPRYDLVNDVVELTVSRSELATRLPRSARPGGYLRDFSVNLAENTGGKFTHFSDGANTGVAEKLIPETCDRWLATHRVPTPRCALTAADPVADEASPAGHDDDLDLIWVRLQVTPTQLVRTVRLARLQGRPLLGTGHVFQTELTVAGKPLTWLVDTATADLAGLPTATTFDASASTVTSVVKRTDLAKKLGTTLSRTTKYALGATTTKATSPTGGYTSDTAPAAPKPLTGC